jgi:methyltransferase (TIGR00027 family)
MSIQNVSDTARWVAMYRAMESERPDAHFRDPFARRLAGEQGEAILAHLPQGRSMAWPMIVRTQVFDEVILRLVREQGVDLVLNLAAGLDARPWRLDLPPTLQWVDVDLPGMIEHKASVMAGEAPRCHYQAVAADLAESAQREAVLARFGGEGVRGLVVSEGLLVYLSPADVALLAKALRRRPGLEWWLTDLASPALLKRMRKTWGRQLQSGNAPFRFAPAEGSGFFAPYGWREVEWHGTMEDAHRLDREGRGMWFWRRLLKLAPARRQEEFRRFAGNLLMRRA